MAKKHPKIITAIDIGSGSIKLASVLKNDEDGTYEMLAQYEEPSLGIRKGVVVDVSRVSQTISSLVSKLEEERGFRAEKIYANIGGGHISSLASKGLVSVSRADRKISEEDVERVIHAAETLPLQSNREIVQVLPKEFVVDGQSGVKEVVDMEGARLEVETLLLCGFSPYIRNSSKAITSSGCEGDFLVDPLASSKSVLTQREKELGVCVLDIGSGTTSMAVYEEGSLIHATIFPIGSGHITNDIAICLKTDIDTAEKIKLEYGMCKEANKKKSKKIKLDGEDNLDFSSKLLTDIVNARVSEIFNLANKELKNISKNGVLPAGIVLTGGGAKLPGIRDLAKKELKLPCRIGKPKEFRGFQSETRFATLCGLILEGFEVEDDHSSPSIIKSGIVGKIKNIFKTFIP